MAKWLATKRDFSCFLKSIRLFGFFSCFLLSTIAYNQRKTKNRLIHRLNAKKRSKQKHTNKNM
ncbi:hypothetical protein BGL71_07630 [Helicobacter pylori]|nr:hypothetical protein BGL71_07630 [Helicobacter pylori]QEF42874.1 hypothetical protein D2C73_08185 [Helicobacter pylori]QEF42880.1 hypothetical protein D2C73_08230 [Helicobacter pylori]